MEKSLYSDENIEEIKLTPGDDLLDIAELTKQSPSFAMGNIRIPQQVYYVAQNTD